MGRERYVDLPEKTGWHMELFLDEVSQLLLQSIISYLREEQRPEEQNFHMMLQMISLCKTTEDAEHDKSVLDYPMKKLGRKNIDSYALNMYSENPSSSPLDSKNYPDIRECF